MTKQHIFRWAPLVAVLTVLAAGLLTHQAAAQTPTATPPATPTATPTPPPLAACPAGLAISVTAPTAAAPTTVTATITPSVNLKPASAGDLQSFHLHYYVDIDPRPTLKPGDAVPSGNPQIIHSGTTTQDLGALTPGPHTVYVVLGQISHQACGSGTTLVTGSTAFTAAAAAATPAPAKTGNAGLLPRGHGAAMPLALGLLAVMVVVLARRATTRAEDRRG